MFEEIIKQQKKQIRLLHIFLAVLAFILLVFLATILKLFHNIDYTLTTLTSEYAIEE